MRAPSALLALAFFSACADPEDPDAGTPDLGFADAGFTDTGPRPDATPDASQPDATQDDATPTDAGMFTIVLTTSSTVVTDETPIVLSAVPMGETSTVVDFYDGTTLVGSSTAAPFTLSLAFTSAQNGTHVYRAEASANGNRESSNDVSVEVLIPRGTYVDPVSGLDTNAGTLAEPFKTIRHAASVSTPGDSIFLLDGQYDLANQGNGFGSICPSVTITASVSVRAVNAGDVTLVGAASGCAFSFVASGDVYGVRFSGFQQALNFFSGRSTISESSFDNCAIGVFANNTSRVRMEAPTASPSYFANYQASGFGVSVATVEETAQLAVVGGTFEGLPTYGIGMFLARDTSRLVMEGVTIRDNGRAALRINDNAHVVLRDTVIDDSSGTGLNAEYASINIASNNVGGTDEIGLELERSQILNSNAHGISAVFYNVRATHLLISLVDSRIQDQVGTAILVDGAGVPNPGLNVDVRMQNSVILGGARGIFGLLANVDIDGGEVSGTTGVGITLGYGGFPNRLTVRNATFDGNGDDTIRITDAAMIVDLGTALDPGANSMSAIPTGASAVALTVALTADAVGNTWMASEQGADATGHYPAATTATGPTSGLNYDLVTGATLVLEP